MLRIGLIGGGSHSRGEHLPALALYAERNPGAIELAAFCDRQPSVADGIARAFGFGQVFTDAATMLAEARLDGCIAVTPVPVTAAVVAQVIEAGVPLLMEKPPGATREEARALRDLAAARGAHVMVSVNRRFDPALTAARDWVGNRPIESVHGIMLRGRRTEPGFLASTGIHALDALRFLAGDVVHHEVSVRKVDGVRWYAIALNFTSGAWGRLDIMPTCGVLEETYEIFGPGYRVRVAAGSSGEDGFSRWADGEDTVEQQAAPGTPRYVQNGTYAETAAFIEGISAGRTAPAGLADIWPSADLCFRIEQEAR